MISGTVCRENLTYIAGFFDGEGTISSTATYYNNLRIGITNTCKAPLTFIMETLGGYIYEQKPTPIGRRVYLWQLCGDKAATALEFLLPYLIVKKEEALLGIQLTRIYDKDERYKVAKALRALKCVQK